MYQMEELDKHAWKGRNEQDSSSKQCYHTREGGLEVASLEGATVLINN